MVATRCTQGSFRNKVLISAAVAAACTGGVAARADVSYSGGSYTQNFDSLSTSPVDTYNNTPATVQTWTDNTPSNGTTDGLNGWYASEQLLTGSSFIYYVSDGAGKTAKAPETLTGGLYDFGSSATFGSGPITDRALGLAGTSTSGIVTVGVKLINTSTTTYNQLNIGYTGEQWFSGSNGVAKSLTFDYGIFNNDGSSNVTSATTTDSNLNFNAPVVNASTTTSNALDGNLAANSQALAGTENNVSWAPGQVLWLTWQIGSTGKGSALAIDNLNFQALVSAAKNLTWNPGSTTWTANATVTNWLNGTTASNYSQGDLVTFGDTGVGPVTIDAAGVSPGALTVSNNSGTYTFSGGSIGGVAALTKTGSGTLVLTNSNTYGGGTVVSGGTLSISNDNNLGAASGGVTLSGGTLQITAPITSARTVTLLSGSSTLDTGSNTVTFASLASSGGSLTKIGNGSLSVTSIALNANTLSVAAGSLVLTQAGGTSTFGGGGSDAGNIVIAAATRLSINGGSIGGGGQVQIAASGGVLNAAGAGATTDVTNNIVLNPNNLPLPFNAHIGATSTDTMQIDGVISGNSDVVFTNAVDNGGAGLVLLNSNSNYTGNTTIDLSTVGVVRIGTTNALPTHTNLSFGDGVNTGAIGALDLNGFDLSLGSIATNLPNANGTTSQIAYGITNTGFSTNTLTIDGSASTTYNGTIGVPPAFANGTISQLGGASDNIALRLASTNTGTLNLTGASTYNAGTTIGGGTLLVNNTTGSATGTGNVTLNNGTFGGAGLITGIVIAGTGPHTITPGTAGSGSIGTLTVGGLTTNANTTLSFDLSSPTTTNDLLAVTGTLSLNGGKLAITSQSVTGNGSLGYYKAISYGTLSGGIAGIVLPTVSNNIEYTLDATHDAGYIDIHRGFIGDANDDGKVDLSDLNIVLNNLGANASAWGKGNFDGAATIDLTDLNDVLNHLGTSIAAGSAVVASGTTATPEPASLAVLALGGAALMARRRRM